MSRLFTDFTEHPVTGTQDSKDGQGVIVFRCDCGYRERFYRWMNPPGDGELERLLREDERYTVRHVCRLRVTEETIP